MKIDKYDYFLKIRSLVIKSCNYWRCVNYFNDLIRLLMSSSVIIMPQHNNYILNHGIILFIMRHKVITGGYCKLYTTNTKAQGQQNNDVNCQHNRCLQQEEFIIIYPNEN